MTGPAPIGGAVGGPFAGPLAGPLAEALARVLTEAGIAVRRDVVLAPFTTFRIGGPAALMATVADAAQLAALARIAARAGCPGVLVIGQGSNLLVADEGVDGLVVRLDPTGFGDIRIDPDPDHPERRVVRAGGAVKLPVLARTSVAAGCAGLEWLVGVPGSVGGAVRMNAGGHGSDMAASIISAHIISLDTGDDRRVPLEELHLAYRRSAVGDADVVVDGDLCCRSGDRAAGERELAEIVRWRREHQPGGANCGSVFTNPPGDSAGRLIDAAGLKGHRIGGAWVSDKHANFIQADPGTRATDVWALIEHVRAVVHAGTGIVLHPEVRTAGRFPALRSLVPDDPRK
jgi:UDP-N-acetylmuramate dehydrogenase